MPDLSILLNGILIPAVIAGIVLLVSARRARRHPAVPHPAVPRPAVPRPFAGALAIGAGYLVAHAATSGIPSTPWSGDNVGSQGWIFWMVAAAVVLAPLRIAPGIARYANSLYVAAFSILPYRLIGDAGASVQGIDYAGFGGVLLVYAVWTATERLSLRRPGPSLPLALWAACAGTAAMALANKSIVLAQLLGAVAAGLGAAVVVALLVRGAHLASGVVALLAVVVVSLVRRAIVYDLPTECWVLVACAFLGPWLGEIRRLRARSPKLAGAVAFLAALIPALAAAAFARAAK